MLIRQPPRDGSRDYRPTLLGLKYGGVPSINSLNSVYQFQVKTKETNVYYNFINGRFIDFNFRVNIVVFESSHNVIFVEYKLKAALNTLKLVNIDFNRL